VSKYSENVEIEGWVEKQESFRNAEVLCNVLKCFRFKDSSTSLPQTLENRYLALVDDFPHPAKKQSII
jgi:hypothetical protein